MIVKSVMPSNYLILSRFLLLLPSTFPSIKFFSSESVLHIRWPKYWNFSFTISPSNEYSELISFRIDWFDFLAVQGTLKSFLQHHSSKASILWWSAFFIVQHSYPYMSNYTKEILSLIKSSRSHNRFPNLGMWQKGWEPPGNFTLEASGIWLQNFHRMGETFSWRAQMKPCVHQDPGERSSVLTRDFMKLKDELLRFVGANMLLVKSGEISAERMKRWSHKSKVTVSVQESPVVDSLASSQTIWREYHPTHQQKIWLKIYWAWLWPSEQDQFSPQSVSPIRKLP